MKTGVQRIFMDKKTGRESKMKTRAVLALVALWLGLTAAAPMVAPGLDSSTLPQKLDALMSGYAETQFFTGVLLVAKDDAVLYQKAFGMADRERGVPNGLATRCNIASMGKTFTAVLVMQLVEQGKLSLDTPIRAYLPEYRIPNADKITMRHLLTHTSGLSNYMLHPQFEARRAEDAR